MADEPILNILNKKQREDELNRRKRALKERLAKQKKIFRDTPQEHGGDGGLVGKAAHLVGLQKEGIAFQMIITMIVNLFELMVNIKFLIQQREYSDAKNEGIAYTPEAQANGDITLYHVDDKGKVDFENPYPLGATVPRKDIRANGYIPPPSQKEAFEIQFAAYKDEMYGKGYLSDHEKEVLYKSLEVIEKRRPQADLAADQAARQAFQAAKPKPSGG